MPVSKVLLQQQLSTLQVVLLDWSTITANFLSFQEMMNQGGFSGDFSNKMIEAFDVIAKEKEAMERCQENHIFTEREVQRIVYSFLFQFRDLIPQSKFGLNQQVGISLQQDSRTKTTIFPDIVLSGVINHNRNSAVLILELKKDLARRSQAVIKKHHAQVYGYLVVKSIDCNLRFTTDILIDLHHYSVYKYDSLHNTCQRSENKSFQVDDFEGMNEFALVALSLIDATFTLNQDE